MATPRPGLHTIPPNGRHGANPRGPPLCVEPQEESVQELIGSSLAPTMRAWALAAERESTNIPMPTDAPQAHAAGVDSDRILIFDSGPAVGRGVMSHDLALPGAPARAVSARTGRGVDVDLVARTRMPAGTALTELDDLRQPSRRPGRASRPTAEPGRGRDLRRYPARQLRATRRCVAPRLRSLSLP